MGKTSGDRTGQHELGQRLRAALVELDVGGHARERVLVTGFWLPSRQFLCPDNPDRHEEKRYENGRPPRL